MDVVFDVPGSRGTYAEGINNSGVVTGWYADQSDGNRYSYIRYPSGELRKFGVSGSTMTQASAINDAGFVAGIFYDSASFGWRGFVRDRFGRFDLFDLPRLATASSIAPAVPIPIGPQVIARINNKGTVAGDWYHGFSRVLLGQVTVFDGPLGDSVSSAYGLNDRDEVVGQYHGHGYIRISDGTLTLFDPPGSTSTDARGINNNGVVVGSFLQGNRYRGFIRMKNGDFVLVDVPGAQNTVIWDINQAGDVAGFTFDYAFQNVRGFILDKNGSYTTIGDMK